jgi:serine protease Do
VIVEVNGKPMEDSRQLRNTISMMDPTSTVKLKLLRNGRPTDVTVNLGEMPTDKEQAKAEEGSSEKALDGVTVENLDAQSARQLGLPASTSGVVVTDINPSSPLASAGLRTGDVILEVNHQPVRNVAQLEEAVRKAGPNPLLLVNRKGSTLFLAE